MTTPTAATPQPRTATRLLSDPYDAVVVELTDIVARATRYPADILEPHADFEHDLGIDSVKLGEILVLVRQRYGIADAQRIDPDRFRTIASSAHAIAELLRTVPGAPAHPAAAPTPEPAPARIGDVVAELTALIAEATRYPVEILEPQADFEHDLGIDSVKLGEILVLVRRHFALADDVAIAPDAFRNIELAAAAIEIVLGVPSAAPAVIPAAEAEPLAAGTGHSTDALITTITRVVAQTTRYPVDILQPDADFEHDLGIDSVKLGEIVVVLRTELGLNEAQHIAADRFRTIADAAAALSGLLTTATTPPELFSVGASPAVSSAALPAQRPAADLVTLVTQNGGKPFLGKTVLVTGSGHGIGKEIAQSLGALGATVVVNAFHSREAGESTTREIIAAGGDAHFIWASVANARQRAAMFDEIESRFGGLDFLICNASNGLIGPFDGIREEDWEKGFRTNVVGLHHMSLLAAELMSKRGGGKIVTLSSTASYRHINGFGCMAALKSAVESLTRTMAVEFERHNVAVTCLSPGPVEGDLITKFPDADRQIQHWKDLSIGKRLVTSYEIANFVGLLLLGIVPSLNGSVIVFDHGLSYAL
jgi:enoyl-[acyl-carrier protein] reductase III